MSAKKDSYNQHQILLKAVQLRIQKEFHEVRLFSIHVGKFLNIRVIEAVIESVLIFFRYPRKDWAQSLKRTMMTYMVHSGVPGMADLNGIIKIGPYGVRIEVEIKTGKARQSTKQRAYQRMIESLGGIYIVARSEEQAVKELREKIEEKRKVSQSL